ncbi:MAG TPA: hypothetical protein VF652_04015 [Allosphingosinicella sp.]
MRPKPFSVLFAALIAAPAASAPDKAAPAASAPDKAPPAGMVAVAGALKHEATGVTLPDSLGGMTRVVTSSRGVMAMYMPKDLSEMLAGKVALIGIDKFDRPKPEFATMREDARGAFHETGVPVPVEESTFTWPGHPGAATFHGRYVVGPYRKDYWRASDQGWEVNAIVTTPRRDEKLTDRLSKAVATEVFGGATFASPASR